MKDYYRILGVSEQAAEKEIKAAYRKLAKQYHPDVVQDDAEKHSACMKSRRHMSALGDEKSRKEYDKARMGNCSGYQAGKQRSENTNEREEKNGQPAPDMSQFERFFGFQPEKGWKHIRVKR